MASTILVYGIVLMALYSIVAIGFSVIYGVADIINLSHGMIILIAMYATFEFTVGVKLGLVASMTGGILTAIVLLTIIYLGFIRRMLSAPHTSMLLLTAGIANVIQQLIILLVGPNTKYVPSIVLGSSKVLGVVVSNQQIIAVIIAFSLVGLLAVFLQTTKTGRAIRAVTQNKDVAAMHGVNPASVYIYTVIISGFLAGVAGILVAPIQSVMPEMGWSMMVTAFTVTILSGLGAPLWGIVIAAAMVAYAELLTAFFVSSMLSEAAAFLIMIFTLMFKPSGLFGRTNV